MYRLTWEDEAGNNTWEDFEEGELQVKVDALIEAGVDEDGIKACSLDKALLPMTVSDGILLANY